MKLRVKLLGNIFFISPLQILSVQSLESWEQLLKYAWHALRVTFRNVLSSRWLIETLICGLQWFLAVCLDGLPAICMRLHFLHFSLPSPFFLKLGCPSLLTRLIPRPPAWPHNIWGAGNSSILLGGYHGRESNPRPLGSKPRAWPLDYNSLVDCLDMLTHWIQGVFKNKWRLTSNFSPSWR